MEIRKVIIDGKEIEVALKVDKEYIEKNNLDDELDNTLQLNEINNKQEGIEDER